VAGRGRRLSIPFLTLFRRATAPRAGHSVNKKVNEFGIEDVLVIYAYPDTALLE